MEPIASPPSARRVLLLLVALAGALVALSIVQRDRALEQGYEAAERRAELYAGTVIRSSLTGSEVAEPLEAQDRTALLAEIQGFVMTDPAVARVRLWRSDGTLLFSTDPADGAGATSEDPSIERAADGQVTSRLAAESLSPPATEGGEPEVTPLFQTFAPLRTLGGPTVSGAAEIEQFAATLEEAADDPWWVVQVVASGIAVMLALLAFVSVARGSRRRGASRSSRQPDAKPARRKRRDAGWEDADVAELRERLEGATKRAEEAEASAKSFATRLREVSARLETVEGQTADGRVDELREALRRSEAERAMLRAGRPETQVEAEMRELRQQLRESQALAAAAGAVAAGDLEPVKEQLALAARQVDEAVERAKIAEGRAFAAEDRAQAAGDMVSAAERRIDALEAGLSDVAATGLATGVAANDAGGEELRAQLAEADRRVAEAQARANDLEAQLAAAGSLDGQGEELLAALEARLVAAEARAAESEARVSGFEDATADEGSSFRHRLGISAAGRKLAAPPPVEVEESQPEIDLRAAIARGLRAPLRRATGLTMSLQRTVGSGEGKAALRQLSSSLRRLDRLTVDLHEVQRIIDGSLPLQRRRTDLTDLVATAVDESDSVEERVVRFDADAVHAFVDPERARQIVDGMLDAARERTRTGSAIVVRVRDVDTGARVSVEDDNRIPAALGPDLSLAARLAELHGTGLTIDGSSVSVVFPKDGA
jgi:hypothetical protein